MYACYIQSVKILASFYSWAGWFECYLVENPQSHVFAWCGSSDHGTAKVSVPGHPMSQLMRLWYLSSSVNSFFKRAYAAIQWVRCLNFGRTLRLLPYFMYANSEGSGETARMRRLTWAFAGRLCDKYQNFMSWLLFLWTLIGQVKAGRGYRWALFLFICLSHLSFSCVCYFFFLSHLIGRWLHMTAILSNGAVWWGSTLFTILSGSFG